MKPQPTLSLSVRLWLHSKHAHFGSFFLAPKNVKSLRLVQTVSAVNEQGCHNLASAYGAQRDSLKGWVYRERRGSNPLTIYIYRVN